jgi:hypothetical protein
MGVVLGDVLRRVCESKHQLKNPPAWAFDVAGLRHAQELGADLVRVEVSNTGDVFEAPIHQLWEHGFQFDRGFGRQVALEVKWWKAKRPGIDQAELL